MTKSVFGRRVRVVLAATISAAVLGVASPGRAGDDAGIGAFFREQFGIGAAPDAAPQQPAWEPTESRPVIIRPRHRHVAARRLEVKVAVGPVAPVSIYEDKTLRAGDAVMTAKGVRVFMGGHGTPYAESDFAALTDADGLPKQVAKALLIIDKAPRT